MRTLIYITILVAILYGCDKPKLGFAYAKKNDKIWKAKVFEFNDPSTPGLDISLNHNDDCMFEYLDFYNVDRVPGYIQLDTGKHDSRVRFYIIDYDIIFSRYSLLINDDVEDFIKLTHVDGDNVRGYFHCSMLSKRTMNRDTLIFKGWFSTR